MQSQRRRAAIYCRISETDEHVDKVELQEKACRAFAKKQGYDVVRVYADDGISGYKFKERPEYLQLLTDAEAGKFDVLVATFEDRLSRQPSEKLALAAACATGGVVWHTVHDGLVDPASEEGELFLYFRGWMGRKEQTHKIKRLRDRFDERRAAGLPLWGNRPFGFELDRITHREDEAAELRWAYERILEEGSIYSIIKSWNERGIETSLARDRREKRERGELVPFDERNKKLVAEGKPPLKEPSGWSYATVQQLLKRPRNAGLMEVNGEVDESVQAKWEAIVDRDVWEAVRAALTDPTKAGAVNREPRWLCSGLARCSECGEVLRSATAHDRKQKFPVYRCSRQARMGAKDGKRHVAAKCDELDALVRDAIVSTFLFGPAAVLPEQSADLAEVRRIQKRLSEVRQGQADISELVGTPGFKPAVMKKRGAELAAEEDRLQAKLDEYRRNSAHAAMLVESRAALFAGKLNGKGKKVSIAKAADLKAELAERFDALPLEQRRTLVRSHLAITVHPSLQPDKDGRLRRTKLADRVDIDNLTVPSLSLSADEAEPSENTAPWA